MSGASPVFCLDCRHVHGGRAFGVCLERGCDCVAPRRWPVPFAGEAEWRAWCARDRADEIAEQTDDLRTFEWGGG